MGTKASITLKNTVYLTHWDGQPGSLGEDLKNAVRNGSSKVKIKKVADNHLIDAVVTLKQFRETYSKDWFFDYHYKVVGKSVFVKGSDSNSKWSRL